MDLLQRVRSTIERHQLLAERDTVVIGVSGGPDSLCLLHLLLRLRDEYALRLHVAHLNHCLRGAEADADAEFVAQVAQQWGLSASVESQRVAALAQQKKLAIEEAARQARYAFLARVAQQVGASTIAVGHNADDQVETILMHWLRGSGLAGLRGMLPACRLEELRLADGEEAPHAEHGPLLLIRPLLEIFRSDIEAYCAERGLQPRFDRSNLDTTYYRNRLRHELLPFLQTFNPRIREVLLRSAHIITADYALLRQAAAEAWAEVTITESGKAITFDLHKWRALPLSLQRSILREAIHRLRRSLRNINWVHVEDALHVLQESNTGAMATLPSGLEARISYDKFIVANKDYIEPLPDAPWLRDEIALSSPGWMALPGSDWSITAELIDSQEVAEQKLRHARPWQAYLDYDLAGGELSLRPRRAHDRFWPQGLGDKPTTVNSFMTNAKIPRAWRDHIPLLVSPTQVLWIPGWRIDERAKVTEKTTRILSLAFDKRHEGGA
jgi:tRNA(Ile)-lysidine synthase